MQEQNRQKEISWPQLQQMLSSGAPDAEAYFFLFLKKRSEAMLRWRGLSGKTAEAMIDEILDPLNLSILEKVKAGKVRNLYSYTNTSILNSLKKKNPHNTLLSFEEDWGDHIAGDDSVNMDFKNKNLENSFWKLPAESREILSMRLGDAFKYEDIAKRLNKEYKKNYTEGAVKMKFFRLLDKLKKAILAFFFLIQQ